MKNVLGRGLESLIPQRNNTTTSATPAIPVAPEQAVARPTTVPSHAGAHEVPLTHLEPNPNQPRKHFDPTVLKELADSIREHGILQPLLVKPLGGGRYQIIAGERRYQAAKQIGLTAVPVMVKDVDEHKGLAMAIVENVQRKNLNPIERAMAYQRLVDEFGLTQEDVAKRVGKDRTSVANTLRLVGLPATIKRAMADGKLTEGHARALLAIEDPQKQMALFDEIIAKKLSVRQVEALAAQVRVHGYERALPKSLTPALAAQVKNIEQRFGTKVRLSQRGKSGSVTIAFYNDEERNKLLSRLEGDSLS